MPSRPSDQDAASRRERIRKYASTAIRDSRLGSTPEVRRENARVAEHVRRSLDRSAAERREPMCYGFCGSLGWTVEQHGRVTHKQACPHRCEPWCQAHPAGCPLDCVPLMWKEWVARVAAR